MDRAIEYLPMDWRQALARGETLPERLAGAALFADISGFTPLTQSLAVELGPKRGAEELTRHLNRVYDALIVELHRYGGSVISFSGDAITCWFTDDDGRRAATCALAMQRAMGAFAESRTASGRVVPIGVKIGIAVGPVRRFLSGRPAATRLDALAGRPIDEAAAAEHHAGRGEVLLAETAAAALSAHLDIAAWRADDSTGARFAVVRGLRLEVTPTPWPPIPADALTDEQVAPWLLPAVWQRLRGGGGDFLAELRPVAALFLRFSGIQFETDDAAGAHLDQLIGRVQQIVQRYDGSLLQLTIGDKGSYLYAAFGAPIAHEDDMARAASAALAFQQLPAELSFLQPVQIGLAFGQMRVGAYGGSARRTYGAIGDVVNLAARLMTAARPGEILGTDLVREETAQKFSWEQLPAMQLKGLTGQVTPWRLIEWQQQQRPRLTEPHYHLPMVGRQAELVRLSNALDQALSGRGQIVGIVAEAGMGKSRLAAEAIHLASARGFVGYGGECQSYGTTTSYLVWQDVWRGLFDLDAPQPLEAQRRQAADRLAGFDPALLPRLPLLGPVLNLSIPDNDLTQSLDPKIRKSSLESLLLACLQARARQDPLLIVLEDCHWLDPLSIDLLTVIARAIGDLPVLLLLAYRPPDARGEQLPRIDQLPYFSEIALTQFTADEAERLIQLKLAYLLGDDSRAPADFVAEITRRAAGNPFYIEELVNYLQDLGIDPRDAAALAHVDLPTSIYSLILSRIDKLGESEQITIRVASVIGRLFKAAMVWGVYPELGELQRVQHNLDVLSNLELTPMDMPEPELTYLFKHVMTQEVAYESLLYATRAMLHEQIGLYIERSFADNLDRYATLLAYHFENSDNVDKQRTYFVRAGAASQADYANGAAIAYFEKALPLLAIDERPDVLVRLGRVLELTGRWPEALDRYEAAVAAAAEAGVEPAAGWAQTAVGELKRKQSHYDEALDWLARARRRFERLGDQAGIAQTLHYAGSVAAQKGDFALARALYRQSLAIREQLGDRAGMGSLYSNLGIVARLAGELDQAQTLHEQGLALRREVGDRWAVANSLNNLGAVFISQGAFEACRPRLEEALRLYRQIGDPHNIALVLNNLGGLARREGEFERAVARFREALLIWRNLGELYLLGQTLNGLGLVAAAQGAHARALQLTSASAAIRAAAGAPLTPADQAELQRLLASSREALGSAAEEAWQAGARLTVEEAIAQALS